MPKTCGIEIKGSTAIIVVLEGEPDKVRIIPTEFKKLNLDDSTNQDDVKAFSTVINNFFNTNNFNRIGIKGRATKGKFAGGSTSFKIEGLIQLTNFPVSLISGRTLKSKLKNHEVDCSGVNNYQVEAMKLAYCLLLEETS